MMKLEYKRASCHVECDFMITGSVLKGTVQATWNSVSTSLKVESDEDLARIAVLIRNAKRGCIAENLVVQRVPLHSKAELNGSPLDVEAILE